MSTAEVLRMPKVTLYVKDADAPIWERARQLAGDSLSSIVSLALAAYVDEQETKARAGSALQRDAVPMTLDVEPEDGPRRKVRFTGVLAYEGDAHEALDVYVTTSGKIVLAHNARFASDMRTVSVTIFDTYQEFLSSDPNPNAGAGVAEVLGEEWIEEID